MTVKTVRGDAVPGETVSGYLDGMVGKIFKILPIREQDCPSLTTYLESLQDELLGFMWYIKDNPETAQILSVISILQYLRDTTPCVGVVKRETFKAIGICKRLSNSFGEREGRV